MSLSTQLTRGTLALPLLVLFGALALAAGEPVDAHPAVPRELPPVEASAANAQRQQMIAVGRRLVIETRAGETGCGAHPRPQLLLAQAPGDLGPIAQRGGCRA